MNAAVTHIIQNLESGDSKIYNEAFKNLIAIGLPAMPALVELLADQQRQNRALAAAAIADIADRSYANMIVQYVDDSDPYVRAWSAVALRRMNDPRALQALLKTINDYPDEAHTDQTLATYALIQWGDEVLLPVTGLLNAPDRQTRRHAFAVLKKIVFNKLRTKEAWENSWKENGSYDPDSEEPAREEAVAKWQKWITDRYEPGNFDPGNPG